MQVKVDFVITPPTDCKILTFPQRDPSSRWYLNYIANPVIESCYLPLKIFRKPWRFSCCCINISEWTTLCTHGKCRYSNVSNTSYLFDLWFYLIGSEYWLVTFYFCLDIGAIAWQIFIFVFVSTIWDKFSKRKALTARYCENAVGYCKQLHDTYIHEGEYNWNKHQGPISKRSLSRKSLLSSNQEDTSDGWYMFHGILAGNLYLLCRE